MAMKVICGLVATTVLTSGGVSPALAQTAETPAAPAAPQAAAGATPPAAAASQPQAPAAVPPATTVVEITGIRSSLESARNQKRNAIQFVDDIVADDIGKLPDRNVAESLSRVSGVQVDRGIGEGTNVSIRGLRQNVTLFNGREIFDATGRGGTGLDQLGTSTYGLMALVPSELISTLEVTKLAGANQMSGGLGGIVDIRSRLPLDEGNRVVGKAGLTYDQLPGKTGGEFFGLVSRRFDDNRLGIMAALSHDERRLSQQGLDTFAGYKRFSDTTTTPPTPRYGDQDVRASDIEENRRKTGLNAALQWRPASGYEVVADTFLSRLDSARDRHWIGFNPTAGLTSAVYSDNDILVAGHANTPVHTDTEFADVKADIASTAVRAKYVLTDSLQGSAEISDGRSTASYHQRYMRLQSLPSLATSVDFDLRQGSFGAFTINGVDLTDPSQMNATILFDSWYRAKTDNKAARVDFSRAFDDSWLDSIDFGTRFSRIDSSQNPLVVDIRPTNLSATQLGDYLTTYSNGSFASGDFAGLPRSYLAPSRSAFTGCRAFTSLPAISQNAACLDPASQLTSVASTFDIDEKFTEGYLKANFDTAPGGAGVSGNVGVRMVHRELVSVGSLIDPSGATQPNTATQTNNEALPSAVARIAMTKDTVLRLGAARVVSFPNTADLNNGVRLYAPTYTNGVLTSPGTGTGGSPHLQPFKATQVDVSFEKYFGRQGMASLGLFNKDVSTYIVQKQISETYGGVDYLVNRAVNGEGAKVRGAEFLVQLPFYFLPDPFNGFGTMVTYSFIDSKTPVHDAAGRTLTFPGLSRNNVNFVGYFERGPLSVRLALNWRDKYLMSLSAANTGVYSDAYTDMSSTLRYDFSKSLSLGLEADNLLNSKMRTYDGSTEGLRTNSMYGRIFKADVTFKY